jgi:hypothetical protein
MKTTKFRPQQRLLLGFTAIIGMQAATYAGPVADVPDQIKSPAGERLVFQAHASGAQIYVCQQGADGQSQWTLKAPDAQLHDQKGAVVGHHYAGPTWKHNDGSEVTGKASAKADSPDPDSIPWLLITATGHSGSGVFAQVTSIQRIHTKGGHAPAAASCDSSKLGTEAKIPYTADYYFYAPAK